MLHSFPIKHISIIGMGAMGTSLAFACKQHKICNTLTGYVHDPDNLPSTQALQIVDHITSNLEDALKNTSLIILCSPISTYDSILDAVNHHTKPGTLITDIGSVKKPAAESMLTRLHKEHHPFLLPAHPIAGTEKAGAKAFIPNLFENKTTILTPLQSTHANTSSTITEFWKRLNTHIKSLTPKKHDIVYAHISHFPQLLIFAFASILTDQIAENNSTLPNNPLLKQFLRLSGSDFNMWKDIFIYNADAIHGCFESLCNTMLTMHNTNYDAIANAITESLANSTSDTANEHNVITDPSPVFVTACMLAHGLYRNAKPYVSYRGKGFSDVVAIGTQRIAIDTSSKQQKHYTTSTLHQLNSLLSNLISDLKNRNTNTLKLIIEKSQQLYQHYYTHRE